MAAPLTRPATRRPMGCIARLAFLTTLGVTAAAIIGSVRNRPGDDRPDGDDCHDEDRSRRPVTQGCKSPLTATPLDP
jgi:hypothetical protein